MLRDITYVFFQARAALAATDARRYTISQSLHDQETGAERALVFTTNHRLPAGRYIFYS